MVLDTDTTTGFYLWSQDTEVGHHGGNGHDVEEEGPEQVV